MALARAAWAKADESQSALEGKAKPKTSERAASVRRPVRRVHHSWLSSSFAL
jgi:hypothetical protein